MSLRAQTKSSEVEVEAFGKDKRHASAGSA